MYSKPNYCMLKRYFYKFMIIRAFKNFIQPKIPMLDEINLENDMFATLRPPVKIKPCAPTLAGDPRLPTVPHHRIREEVFERWSRASRIDNKAWLKNTILT